MTEPAKKLLRALIVEDSEDDALLLARNLNKHFALEYVRVETAEAFRASLLGRTWDIVLSDHSMPNFSSFAALQIMQQCNKELPFIVVSGAMGDSLAVAALKAGARDILPKGNLEALISVIERELQDRQHTPDIHQEASHFFKDVMLAADNFSEMICITTKSGNIEYVNPAFVQNTGFDTADLQGKPLSVIKSGQHGASFYQKLWETILNGEVFCDVFVNRKANGEIFYEEKSISPLRNRQGEITHFISIGRNVTERKIAGEKLQLAAAVFENSSEGMVITNEDNQIISVNRAFTNITGYTFDEVKGKNPKIFKSGIHSSKFYDSMWESIKSKGKWQGEIWDKRKDGEIQAKLLTINTITDDMGRIYRYVGLFSDITEKKKSEEQMWRHANYDDLTELPNRHMFLERLRQESKKCQRSDLQMALLLIDLDRFKDVNDTLGHDVGDQLLVEVSKRISQCVRETDTVARLGGDEFTVILPEIENSTIVERISSNILSKLSQPFICGAEIFYLSASIGISLFPNDTLDLDVLFRNADQAMYTAKNKGRNCFSYFTADMQNKVQERLRLTNDLRNALELNQFRVFYQPIVDLATGEIRKAEALLRWQHPERGLVSPMDFIPLAEETGLIIPIGDWVFREAVEQAIQWRHKFNFAFQVSVNQSPAQLRQKDSIDISWPEYLAQRGMEGQGLVVSVEITEGMLLKADKVVNEKLIKYRGAGIQVAIDDFGTGYSSLAYLKDFDIDYLKIDRSFLSRLEHGNNVFVLCDAIIAMAHKLGMKVIAEGVETEAQRELLRQINCDYVQGFIYSRPVPSYEFEQYMRKSNLTVS